MVLVVQCGRAVRLAVLAIEHRRDHVQRRVTARRLSDERAQRRRKEESPELQRWILRANDIAEAAHLTINRLAPEGKPFRRGQWPLAVSPSANLAADCGGSHARFAHFRLTMRAEAGEKALEALGRGRRREAQAVDEQPGEPLRPRRGAPFPFSARGGGGVIGTSRGEPDALCAVHVDAFCVARAQSKGACAAVSAQAVFTQRGDAARAGNADHSGKSAPGQHFRAALRLAFVHLKHVKLHAFFLREGYKNYFPE